jgi:hypothetical protein
VVFNNRISKDCNNIIINSNVKYFISIVLHEKLIAPKWQVIVQKNGPHCFHISMYGHLKQCKNNVKFANCTQVNFLLLFHVNKCKIGADAAKHPFNRQPD